MVTSDPRSQKNSQHRDIPLQIWGVAVKVVADGAVVDAAWGQDRLHIVLGHILGQPHRSKDALAVICTQPIPDVNALFAQNGLAPLRHLEQQGFTMKPQLHESRTCLGFERRDRRVSDRSIPSSGST